MIQAYNYLLTSFPMKREVMYPAKNRNELKKVYDEIVSLSKRSPYYKIDISKENQEYTFGIKETALELKTKLTNMLDPKVSNFNTKAVSVSDESVLTTKLISEDTDNIPNEIQLKVNSLASPQVNKGKELMEESYALPRGIYEFTAKVMNDTYPLIYAHDERAANLATMKNFANYLNQSIPGISVSVEKGESKNYSYMKVSADKTGKYGERRFSFEDADNYDEGIVDFFGLNRIEHGATSAKFELNGIDKQTATNTFTLENTLIISLRNVGEEPSILRITPDSEKVLSSVESVLSTYNQLIGLARNRTLENTENYSASKLISEMKSLESLYSEELTACGIMAMEDGSLQIEDSLAVQAARDGGMENLFTRENGFIARLKDKTEAIAINPMEYLEKTIVIYPNSEKINYNNPYVTSMYSGLFFNSYC